MTTLAALIAQIEANFAKRSGRNELEARLSRIEEEFVKFREFNRQLRQNDAEIATLQRILAWYKDAPTPEAWCSRVLLRKVLHIVDPELSEDHVLAAAAALLREAP